MISGYEHRWQVEDQITALERERRGHIRDMRHLEVIDAQLGVFQKELRRMQRAGYYGPEDKPRGGRSMLVRNASTGQDHTEWTA